MNILSAFQLAAQLHAGDVDKAGRPYIEHLFGVFLRVLIAGGDLHQQIAALLHDAIEDGKATAESLLAAGVPRESVDLIVTLTRQPGQKYADYLVVVKSNPKATPVKLADLADNLDPSRSSALDGTSLRKRYQQAAEYLRS